MRWRTCAWSTTGLAYVPGVCRHAAWRVTGPVVVGVDATPSNEPAIGFAFEEAALRTELIVVHSWTDAAIVTATQSREFEPGQALPQVTDAALDERLAHWTQQYPDVTVVRVVRDVTHERPAPALLPHTHTAQLTVVGKSRPRRVPQPDTLLDQSPPPPPPHRVPCRHRPNRHHPITPCLQEVPALCSLTTSRSQHWKPSTRSSRLWVAGHGGYPSRPGTL